VYEERIAAFKAAAARSIPLAHPANTDQFAKATYFLPRKHFTHNDFKGLPIWQPDLGESLPDVTCRVNAGGVWVVIGSRFGGFAMYRPKLKGLSPTLN